MFGNDNSPIGTRKTVFAWLPIPQWRLDECYIVPHGKLCLCDVVLMKTGWGDWVAYKDDQLRARRD